MQYSLLLCVFCVDMHRHTAHHALLQKEEDAVSHWWERPAELWQSGELLLACGAAAVADLRAAVAAELDYSCSAGIAHNKACLLLPSPSLHGRLLARMPDHDATSKFLTNLPAQTLQ